MNSPEQPSDTGGGSAPTKPRGRRRVLETQAALRAQIVSGKFAVGDQLPTEPELTDALGVSRSVLREAVSALRSEGLLESRQGAGVFVLRAQPKESPLAILTDADATIADVIEELELRTAVEVEAAGIASSRASPAQMAEIQLRHQAFQQAVAEGRNTEEADFEFHRAIARATNNTRFVAFLSHLGERTIPRAKVRASIGIESAPTTDAQLNDEHRDIVDAILAQDGAAARKAMRVHLGGSMERYRKLIQLG
ncbi:FadR family transcriptional regulator [Rhodobacteraceae bacterium NNCM2]|nr:FadR family transcriptional regulator [Coraliihabitans acroporae]